jgi:hypothetical protein
VAALKVTAEEAEAKVLIKQRNANAAIAIREAVATNP